MLVPYSPPFFAVVRMFSHSELHLSRHYHLRGCSAKDLLTLLSSHMYDCLYLYFVVQHLVAMRQLVSCM